MARAQSTKKTTLLDVTIVDDGLYRLLHPRQGDARHAVLDTMDRREMRNALIDIHSFVYKLRKALKARGLVAKVRPQTRREREKGWIRDAVDRAARAEYDAELLAKARARRVVGQFDEAQRQERVPALS